jgi:dihydroflavonol-4-reductase
VPTRELPDWLVRAGALFSRDLAAVAPQLGLIKNASGEKAKRLLGFTPRPNEEAITAAAQSLARLGLLKPV